ncbi:restriction endonuclease subunit S [Glutamicibacter sp. MNS18]|uniref:restriction endonuclease subunit S n=1 Tax=Glutamicibacter sp. MNS18 TaxID=2989817 RepID=UPI00223651F3|nr:restriction endonuclease subunit S [Glutamicibacter sp. MNS18]MCW4467271.1 restriction endonuclease subunit S [Glutamicibacter sp. MNS18]
MSRIDELIAEHCSGGVEFRSLVDITSKSASINWKSVADSSFKYIDLSSVDRVTRRIGDTVSVTATDAPSRARQIVRTGDVIFATTRPTQMRWAVIPEEYDKQIASTGYCVLRPNNNVILTNFLAHVLGTARFSRYVESNQVEGNYPSIPDSRVREFRVPVPPLEIQREIVRILDTFSKMEAELEAELEARKQQYEHYRASLLTSVESAKWSTLGDICSRVSTGATPKAGKPEYYRDGTIPWLRTGEVTFGEVFDTEIKITDQALKETGTSWIKENCVIIAISGATAARSAINKIPLTTNQHCCNLQIDESLANYRFVFFWVSSKYEELKSLGRGARSDLNTKIIKNFPIPVPSLEEQARIVGILDKFDALVNDLSVGLPAELAARRQQYEYYRDKLLTFKELESAS